LLKITSKSQTKSSTQSWNWVTVTIISFVMVNFWLLLFLINKNSTIHEPCVKSQDTCIVSLEFAKTHAEQEKGLGGRVLLPSNRGMIFEYPTSQKLCFWMKDTLVPLDMIWLDSNKNIVAVEHNVQPESYPEAFCHAGQYVLEVNAGEAQKHSFYSGKQLNF
jgi:uncharacterized membrane protein (UPF0127 family)